ncbi:hypothetical protein [Martelella sp. HB161492]|uniref:hypothetical protein n=1 Tax=Martelella sp. HB161492 TaxID=2720726 RepID=UPI0015913285|nr:hypothetical protein [Martelella sp. HB161492]
MIVATVASNLIADYQKKVSDQQDAIDETVDKAEAKINDKIDKATAARDAAAAEWLRDHGNGDG